MASADLPDAVGPRTTTSSGSGLAVSFMRSATSSCAPGDGFAESQEGQREDDQRDHQQANDPTALAREHALLLLNFALFGAERIRGSPSAHDTILRERCDWTQKPTRWSGLKARSTRYSRSPFP